jgi:hypothetical protein
MTNEIRRLEKASDDQWDRDKRLEKDRVNDGCLLRRKNNDKGHFCDCAILFYALMVSCV